MTEILIYLTDMTYEDEVEKLMSRDEIGFTVVSNLESVKNTLQNDMFDMAIIWRADYDTISEFIEFLNNTNLDYLPVISVVEDNTQLNKIFNLPIAEYFLLPLPQDEFNAILDNVIQDIDVQSTVLEGMNWQGSLREYNLLDLIQMVESANKNARLTFTYEEKTGNVFLQEGQLIHAEFKSLRGLPALKRMSFWRRGNFQVRFSNHSIMERSISSENQEIFLEIAKFLSDFHQLYKGLPDLYEKIIANPYQKTTLTNSLQEKIWEECRYETTIFNLLLVFEEEKETGIPELKNMFDNRIIDKKHNIELIVQRENEKSGIGKILSSISSKLIKKPVQEGEEDNYYFEETEASSPSLEVKHLQLSNLEYQKIKENIKALY